MGGFGRTYDTYDASGNPTSYPLSSKGLRWGRNRLDSTTSISGGLFTLSDPVENDYVAYEALTVAGDSGSGVYVRDGWEWRHAGYNWGSDVTAPYTGSAALVPNGAIYDQVQAYIASDLPTLVPAPKPVATTTWYGSAGANWATAGNWTAGEPQFNSAQSDIVHINSAGPLINGPATAQDVYVGGAGGAATISAGGQLVIDSLFVGPESGESGIVTLSGGEIRSESQYVGHYGTGTFVHAAGMNKTTRLSVGHEAVSGADQGAYLLLGGTLDASHVQIGHAASSKGLLTIPASSTITGFAPKTLVVGGSGDGELSQSTGTITVSDRLVVAERGGSVGEVALSGDALLQAENTVVGGQGVAEFRVSSAGAKHETGLLIVGAGSEYRLPLGTLELNASAVKNLVAGTVHGDLILEGGTMSTFSRGILEVKDSGRLDVGLGSVHSDALIVDVGGTIILRNGSQLGADATILRGTLDFDGGATTGQARGLVDLSSATIANAGGSDLSVYDDGLVIVSSAVQAQLSVTTSGQPAHLAGTVLTIDQHTVRGAGLIEDRVEVVSSSSTSAGKLYLQLGGAGTPLANGFYDFPDYVLNGGLHAVGSHAERPIVDLGDGGLRVPAGQPSTIDGDTVDYTSSAIILDGGTLFASGDIDVNAVFGLSGELEVGDVSEEVATLQLGPKGSLLGSSDLIIDIASTGADSIEVSSDANSLSDINAWDLRLRLDPGTEIATSRANRYTILSDLLGLQGFQNEFNSITLEAPDGSPLTATDLNNAGVYLQVDYVNPVGSTYQAVEVWIALLGDANGDGVVNGVDVLEEELYRGSDYGGVWGPGDTNGDGLVNGTDMLNVQVYFGNVAGQSGSPIPEPGAITTAALLALAAGSCPVRSSRRSGRRV